MASASPQPAPNNKSGAGKDAWSAPYREDDDNFDDFATFVPTGEALTPTRQLSQRQLSGHFEEEGTGKAWEEDWDDEDVDDTFDKTMERIARGK
jgi:hypothetical protein